jgi:AcrR family transcriptional regulator
MARAASESAPKLKTKRKVKRRAKTKARRIGTEQSKTRAAFLNAAEALVREEGYAAVTTRRVASRAGLKPQLVHYYFRNMDDLLINVWRRFADKNLANHADAMSSGQPLWELWNFNRNRSDTIFFLEFMALARHRKIIGDEMAKDGRTVRAIQLDSVGKTFEGLGLKERGWTPMILITVMVSIARTLVLESDYKFSAGHKEMADFMERWIKQVEGPPQRKPRSRKGSK